MLNLSAPLEYYDGELSSREDNIDEIKTDTEEFLYWLEQDGYIIAKKKDLRKTYQYHKTNLSQLLKSGFKGDDPDVALCRGVLSVLGDLFGKENLI